VLEFAGGIPGEHATLPLQGSGHFIVEAALRTFIPAGGRFLLPLNGTYAERIHRLASESGRVPVTIDLSDTRPVTAAELDAAFAAHPEVTHLCAVVSETGSGIINNDPEVLGAAARRRQAGTPRRRQRLWGLALEYRTDRSPVERWRPGEGVKGLDPTPRLLRIV
jgi:2-aminoethylphosphonate-pyruvate transaminase